MLSPCPFKGALRAPVSSEDEVQNWDLAEEHQAFEDKRENDADGGEDRNSGAQDQQPHDGALYKMTGSHRRCDGAIAVPQTTSNQGDDQCCFQKKGSLRERAEHFCRLLFASI